MNWGDYGVGKRSEKGIHGKVSFIVLGCVGLKVVVAFGMADRTIGFDVDSRCIEELRKGYDHTGEVLSDELVIDDVLFTDRIEDLCLAYFHILVVSAPVNASTMEWEDLSPSALFGR